MMKLRYATLATCLLPIANLLPAAGTALVAEGLLVDALLLQSFLAWKKNVADGAVNLSGWLVGRMGVLLHRLPGESRTGTAAVRMTASAPTGSTHPGAFTAPSTASTRSQRKGVEGVVGEQR